MFICLTHIQGLIQEVCSDAVYQTGSRSKSGPQRRRRRCCPPVTFIPVVKALTWEMEGPCSNPFSPLRSGWNWMWVSHIPGQCSKHWAKLYKMGTAPFSSSGCCVWSWASAYVIHTWSNLDTWLLERGSHLWISSRDTQPPEAQTWVPISPLTGVSHWLA